MFYAVDLVVHRPGSFMPPELMSTFFSFVQEVCCNLDPLKVTWLTRTVSAVVLGLFQSRFLALFLDFYYFLYF
ncbi:hypothetical protein GDO81_024933 [Engystomops pustulosus]|uniref:Uncharacterized protein n=1 Tax=Engystomops pustulosus TaxID=76066 RepID=A0AAV6ZMP6_ENGPU|nr:hypothetical protein GDO81_024933 [Engystomops pustulosus]